MDTLRQAGGPEHYLVDQVLTVIRRDGTWARFKLGGWTAEGEGRLVYQGPLVKGPQLYAFALASVIDNHGGTAKERADLLAAGMEHDIEDGDMVTVDGVTYTVGVKAVGYDRYLTFVKGGAL